MCECIALCTIVAHNIAQNRPDSSPLTHCWVEEPLHYDDDDDDDGSGGGDYVYRSSPDSNVGSFSELVVKLHGPLYGRDEIQPVYRPLVTGQRPAPPSPSNGCDVIDDVVATERVHVLSAPPPTPEIIGN